MPDQRNKKTIITTADQCFQGIQTNAVRQEKYVRIFREMEGEHENIQVEVLFSQHIQQGSGMAKRH